MLTLAASVTSIRRPKGVKNQSKKNSTAPPVTAANNVFDAAAAHHRIVYQGDRGYVHSLTDTEKAIVIIDLADREIEFSHRVQDLEDQKTNLKRRNTDLQQEYTDYTERYQEKRARADALFRDIRLRRMIELQHERMLAAGEVELEKAPTPPSPPEEFEGYASSASSAEEDNTLSPLFPLKSQAPTQQVDPLVLPPVEEAATESTPEPPTTITETETPKPTSFLRRVFQTFSSPFITRQQSTPRPERTAAGRPALGELPASRKRSPPEQEHDTETATQETPVTPAAKRQKTPRAHTFSGPSSKNIHHPTSLSTITEYSEPTERAESEQPRTPSRAPVVASQPPHTPEVPQEVVRRHRTIASVRAAAAQRAAALNNPTRAWSVPKRPRDPNADRRIAKLRRFHELQAQLEEMRGDEEIKELIGHNIKRVKVDELTSIPHNRPGDAASTFRVPDIDSDDEMEVDEDLIARSNVFVADGPGEEPALPAPAVQQSPRPLLTQEYVESFAWPSVGNCPASDREWSPDHKRRGAKAFATAVKHHQETGELLPFDKAFP